MDKTNTDENKKAVWLENLSELLQTNLTDRKIGIRRVKETP